MEKTITLNKAEMFFVVENIFNELVNLQCKDEDETENTREMLKQKEYFDLTQLCNYTNYKSATIYQFVHRKEIPFQKAKRKLIFKRELIDQWLKSKNELKPSC